MSGEIKNPFKLEDGCQVSSRYSSFSNVNSLISGKEAKLAWANGEEIQLKKTDSDFWDPEINVYSCGVFDDSEFEFRIKPRIISINGIEVPAPFEPKIGNEVWFLDDDSEVGYTCFANYEKDIRFYFGCWRTEEEIKQVVEALRSIFK